MNFLPLAVWAVGMALVFSYDDRTYHSLGWSKEEVKKKCEGTLPIWLFGCGIFFILGLLS